MRKWLIPIALVVLLVAAFVAAAYGTMYLVGYFDAR